MSGYINISEYNLLDVPTLKKILTGYGLQTNGTKPQLIERIKTYLEEYNTKFGELYDKYVYGGADTREGKLLRAVSNLVYRYYNEGYSYYETKDEIPDVFSDLSYEDLDFLEDHAFKKYSDFKQFNIHNNLIVTSLIYDTVRKLEEEIPKLSPVKKAKLDRKISPVKETKLDIYTLVVESLEPRSILEIKLFKTRNDLNAYASETYKDFNKSSLEQIICNVSPLKISIFVKPVVM
jgi:hypothetical protein